MTKRVSKKKSHQNRRASSDETCSSNATCCRKQTHVPETYNSKLDADNFACNQAMGSEETNEYKTCTFKQNINSPKPKVNRGHWSKLEDEMLLAIVNIFGTRNWERHSIYHPTRNGKQMRERWLSIQTGVNKEPFTQEEIAIIYYMHDIERIGWANIARRLGNGRMPNSCKNVYHNVVAKSLPKAANRYKELYNAITANKKELTAKEKMEIKYLCQ
ncbi:2109_t:CDS:2 [Paraglomus brasilianum]|uniref:2109_t:CDS:1 n=1 Tax=Paraglomus brasilianum TaxID=144538 RepID=A0A9N9DYM4_9GLOM|nr:2109_t:CDS:2 [Paraglomus brasilianum]